MQVRKRIIVASLAILNWPLAASATNGYFSHGYGVRSQAVAGVGRQA